MKVNFNGKDGNKSGSKLVRGDYEAMIKMRAKQLPEIEATINEALADYDGSMIAIIRIHEDENGKSERTQVMIGGVSHLGNHISLGKGLMQAADELRDNLIESCKGEPKALMAIMQAMMEEIINDKE